MDVSGLKFYFVKPEFSTSSDEFSTVNLMNTRPEKGIQLFDARKTYTSRNCSEKSVTVIFKPWLPQSEPSTFLECMQLCDNLDECVGARWIADDNSTNSSQLSCNVFSDIDIDLCQSFIDEEPLDSYRLVTKTLEYERLPSQFQLGRILQVRMNISNMQSCRVWCNYHPQCQAIEYIPSSFKCHLSKGVIFSSNDETRNNELIELASVQQDDKSFVQLASDCNSLDQVTISDGGIILTPIANISKSCSMLCQLTDSCVAIQTNDNHCSLITLGKGMGLENAIRVACSGGTLANNNSSSSIKLNRKLSYSG